LAGDTPLARAIARTVQWVASPGSSSKVRRITSATLR
jgi:hypothetical protein